MKVQTAHLGPREITEAEIIRFLAPLPPFVGLERFVLVGTAEEEPFLWLQSVDEAALAFVVAPYAEVAGPPPALSGEARASLGLLPEEAPEVYAILCVGTSAAETTMNLLAPVYVCRRTQRGQQIVSADDPARARAPLLAP